MVNNAHFDIMADTAGFGGRSIVRFEEDQW